MSSEHLVDPELRPALAAFPALDITPGALPAMRTALADALAQAGPAQSRPARVEAHHIPGPEGAPTVRVLSYRPLQETGQPLPAILHIHGGGYMLGAPDMMDAANRLLTSELGCAIYSVDYRLAPETPFPGPVEDCYAALRWLSDSAAGLGVDPDRIGVKGESAGGGLAAALALLARDRGGPRLAFQHLIYPMIDDRTGREADPHPFTGEFVWTPGLNQTGWRSLLGAEPGGADVSPYAAAARATNLEGLPPAFIAVGALDLFLEEDIEYARRLSRAGVPVELHVYPGAFHGFDLAGQAKVTRAAYRDSKDALQRALAG